MTNLLKRRILNDGIKKPTVRFESLQFGAGTPYQTLLIRDNASHDRPMLDPAVAEVMRARVASTGAIISSMGMAMPIDQPVREIGE